MPHTWNIKWKSSTSNNMYLLQKHETVAVAATLTCAPARPFARLAACEVLEYGSPKVIKQKP